jgi:hypothetical protein
MSRHMNYFRKHQKSILAVMGVVCMVTFVIGPYLLDLVSGGGGGQNDNPVVVTWRGGKIRESELNQMRIAHNIAVAFLRTVIEEAKSRGGTPVVNGQQLQKNSPPVQDPGIPSDDSDEALVSTMLLAKRAESMGVAVDRQSVIAFLRELSAPELDEGDWVEIGDKALGDGAQMSVNQLFDQIAYELKAQHVRVLAQAGLFAVTPGEVWEYHNRLNRRFAIEAYPVEVKPLMASTGNPDPAELRKLYEDGKARDPNPALPEPGFRQPHRIAFEYMKVNFQPFLDEAKKQITDEQIAKQYETGKAAGKYKQPELPPVEDKPADKPAGDKPADKPADEKPTDDKPATEKPASEDQPADAKSSDKPAEEKPESEKPATAKPATESTEEKPAEDKPAEDKPCSAQEEEPAKPEEKKDVQPADKPEEKPADDKPASEQPANDKPADEKPAEAKPAESKPADDKPAESTPRAEKPAAPQTPSSPEKPASPEPPKEPQFKPLEEVKEEIRVELAQPIAQESLNAAVKKAISEVNEYGRKYRRWTDGQNLKNKPASLVDPGALNVETVAKKYNFDAGSTPLVDIHTVGEYEIGQKVSEFNMQALQQGRFEQFSFADIAFAPDEPLYSPQRANSIEPDVSYIFWRTKEEAAGDRTFDQAKKDIEEAWKLQKAFELAKADAQKLADKAKGAKSLKEVVGDDAKVVTPPPFSWLTTGSLAFGFNQPSLSAVPGIDFAGQDFMEGVFRLHPGEAGIAPNQPHSTVWVVRVLSQEPGDEILRQQFLDTGMNFQVLSIARGELFEVSREWFEQLEKDMDLAWHRPPVSPRGR